MGMNLNCRRILTSSKYSDLLIQFYVIGCLGLISLYSVWSSLMLLGLK